LNSLPVDVMRDRLGSGCVVTVDVSPDVESLDTAPFEHGLCRRVLRTYLNPFGTSRPVPVVDILWVRGAAISLQPDPRGDLLTAWVRHRACRDRFGRGG
jgi:hypothetical protein